VKRNSTADVINNGSVLKRKHWYFAVHTSMQEVLKNFVDFLHYVLPDSCMKE
jgi:hypothetical protein